MDDLLKIDATEQLRKISTRATTATDLMIATLDRIAALNPHANAIVSLRSVEELLAEAGLADKSPPKGPLHGLPIAIKDLANVKGLVTSQGSPLFAETIAPKSDIMVQRIIDAGAIIIGKTNTPEFGLGSHTYNAVHGATENALMPGKSAGGSSGGAAVALATGMTSLADGSDMMGSLRNPAGWNGVYGMRPTWGRVPSEPDGESFLHQLSTNGPMARSPQDIALLLDVQSGRDARQPHGFDGSATIGSLVKECDGLRIGWLSDWGGAFPMEEGLIDHCAKEVQRFEDAGCHVEDVAAPFDAAVLWEAWITLRSWAIAGSLSPLLASPKTRDGLKPEAIWEIERGLSLSAMDVHRASAVRSKWYRSADRLFSDYDALVLPTAQCWPFPIELDWPKEISGYEMDSYHRWMEVVIPVSLIGLPSIAVPTRAEPRPIGLQIFGRRGTDLKLLQISETWHRML